MTSLEHNPEIDITRYRQYLSTQHRVSEWVNKTRPQVAFTHFSKPRRGSNSNSSGSKPSGRRHCKVIRRSSDQLRSASKIQHSLHTIPGVKVTPIPPVIALVSSSLMVWSLDLLPVILALFAFACLLTLATKTMKQKVKDMIISYLKLLINTNCIALQQPEEKASSV